MPKWQWSHGLNCRPLALFPRAVGFAPTVRIPTIVTGCTDDRDRWVSVDAWCSNSTPIGHDDLALQALSHERRRTSPADKPARQATSGRARR
jgi:hypothetical protein